MTTNIYNARPDMGIPQIAINRMASLLPLPFLIIYSPKMMAEYDVLYWNYFHPQVLILYKHSLNLAICLHLLQLVVRMIGVSCYLKNFLLEITQAHRLFAEFLAKDLRKKLD